MQFVFVRRFHLRSATQRRRLRFARMSPPRGRVLAGLSADVPPSVIFHVRWRPAGTSELLARDQAAAKGFGGIILLRGIMSLCTIAGHIPPHT